MSFEMLFFELEHTLAQDWFHLYKTHGLMDTMKEENQSFADLMEACSGQKKL